MSPLDLLQHSLYSFYTYTYETVDILLLSLPPLTPENAPFYITNAIIFMVVFKALYMVLHLLMNKQLGFSTKPHSFNPEHATKILILGDSTAVGTGASKPEDTIAGRFAHDFPNTQIINLGKNGGLISDLRKQIEQVKDQTFEMVIISAGGNDVWSFTTQKSIRKNLSSILPEVKKMSNGRVFFLLYNNIGDAPIFPKVMRFFLKRRCERVYQTIRSCAKLNKIFVIDLFTQTEDNPFMDNPNNLFARDGIHPSSRGYALWYNRMWRRIVQLGFHYE